jgi:hypothetical protein
VAGATAAQLEEKIPFLGVLLKKESDVETYVKRSLTGAGNARARYG